ncbi:NAD(P)-dependent oxidoreductase [Hymenobacter sp. 15J16-1T3B]|uniref:NAD-dependent epimerase/dehydratase family protein n=1 Tax=Hymenobacter sp. 15J16-1T3B TaxID=2886941 RepID=UPI001D0FFF43|nr:NAD(P)-dependent oxidoreductase [Hymenobacter sp. 15J16-1T3B]MCC3159941.1 NAD(P)-dependent oxidoreductase [Hymenobacter sp. 15J16-1T3B]
MKIVLTGSSGRVGRAIYNQLAPQHEIIGIDRTPFATTRLVADFADAALLADALQGADAVIHAAALHAPHVGIVPDSEFERVNVDGTRLVVEAARQAGVPRLVLTSTTALFGHAIAEGRAAWVTDDTPPRPRSIYHRTKLAAEALVAAAAGPDLAVRVLRMSRCYPEPADQMALYRISRGVDVRDVARAHAAALHNDGPAYQCYIISGQVPFTEAECAVVATALEQALQLRAPALLAAFRVRGWQVPASLDRLYVATRAEQGLGWVPQYGFEEVLAQLDRHSLEVLPVVP